MRIPVPEMDERFECVKDALEHSIRLSSVIVEKAEKIRNREGTGDEYLFHE